MLNFYFIVLISLFFVALGFDTVHGLSVVAASRLHCGGFSCFGAQAVGTQASLVAAHGLSSYGSRVLERGFYSFSTQA